MYYSYFTDEETDTERSTDLPKVTTASEGENRGTHQCLTRTYTFSEIGKGTQNMRSTLFIKL